MIKLFKGDCLELMKNIPEGSVDMILCDLPYGTTACKWDTILPFDKLWDQYERIIKTNGAIVLTAAQPFTSALGFSNIKLLRYEWVWEKSSVTGHLNAKRAPMRAHESILVFYKKPPIYNYLKTYGHERKVSRAEHKVNCKESEVYGKSRRLTSYDSTERYPRSVLKFANGKQKSKLHPTQKPVALFEYLIKTYTNENDLVLDNCAGSGTTGEACFNLNRRAILIEQDEKYFGIMQNRIDNLLL